MASELSVVIATRDRVGLLERTVRAVLEQSVSAHEVIIVDDGSVDGTAGFLDGLEDEVVVVHTDGVGVSAARNAGLAVATGEWVLFLDDDDLPETDWLEGLGAMVCEDAGLIGCAVTLHTVTGRAVHTPSSRGDQLVVFLPGAFAARSDLLREVGGYMDGLTYAENTELSMRLLPACRARGLGASTTDRSLHNMFHAAERRSVAGRPEALLMILQAHDDEFARSPASHARFRSIAGVDLWREGRRLEARGQFRQAVRLRPLSARGWFRLCAACVPPIGRRVWVAPSEGPATWSSPDG